MWIATCDDDLDFIKAFQKLLPDLVAKDDQLTFYDSGVELIEAAHKAQQPIDMLFLDMEMPGLCGIESANELRTICPLIEIIVITDFAQYALDSYQFKAFDYLLKPVNPKELKAKIDEVRNKIAYFPKKVLHIKTREIEIKIPYGDILYIESYGRTLHFHTRTSTYPCTKKIADVAEELENDGFYRIHKSYIINLSHIQHINKKTKSKSVIMTNDAVLPVGERNMNDLIILYMESKF